MLALLHPDEDRKGHHQVHLEDLTFVIDLTLMVGFASAIHLLKQRHITLATLAHALSVVFLVFTVGHYAEKHLVGLDYVEDLVRRGPNQGVIKDWFWAGVQAITALGATVARFWSCGGVGIDCRLAGDGRVPALCRCRAIRLRFFAPVFVSTALFVYLCLCARFNAVLGGSVLHPLGGGYAGAVLTSPTLVATICLTGCVSVLLYSVLHETQGIKIASYRRRRLSSDESFSLAHQGGSIAVADRLAWKNEAAEREVQREAHHPSGSRQKHAWPDACRGGEPARLTAKPPFLAGNYSSRREDYVFAKTDSARPREGSARHGIPEGWMVPTPSRSSRNARRSDRHPAPQARIGHDGLSSAGGQWTTQRFDALAATESRSGLCHRPSRTEYSLGCPVQSGTASPGASLTSLTQRRGPSRRTRPEGFPRDEGIRPWATRSAQSPERRCANASIPYQRIDDSNPSPDANTSDSSGGSWRITPDARKRSSPDRGSRLLGGDSDSDSGSDSDCDNDNDSDSDSDRKTEGVTLGYQQKLLLGDDGQKPLAAFRRYSRCAKVVHLDRHKKGDLGGYGHPDPDTSVEDGMVSDRRTSASRSSSQEGHNIGITPKSSAGDVAGGGGDFTVESGITEIIFR